MKELWSKFVSWLYPIITVSLELAVRNGGFFWNRGFEKYKSCQFVNDIVYKVYLCQYMLQKKPDN